jgi:hypothetical protein
MCFSDRKTFVWYISYQEWSERRRCFVTTAAQLCLRYVFRKVQENQEALKLTGIYQAYDLQGWCYLAWQEHADYKEKHRSFVICEQELWFRTGESNPHPAELCNTAHYHNCKLVSEWVSERVSECVCVCVCVCVHTIKLHNIIIAFSQLILVNDTYI